jgi:hypothetical protein
LKAIPFSQIPWICIRWLTHSEQFKSLNSRLKQSDYQRSRLEPGHERAFSTVGTQKHGWQTVIREGFVAKSMFCLEIGHRAVRETRLPSTEGQSLGCGWIAAAPHPR